MNNDIVDIERNLEVCKQFIADYAVHFEGAGNLSVSSATVIFYRKHLVEVGRIFGRNGWTRKISYSNSFDWHKTLNGVKIVVYGAEDNDLNNTPVPEKAFPLQLENVPTVSGSDDEIPF